MCVVLKNKIRSAPPKSFAGQFARDGKSPPPPQPPARVRPSGKGSSSAAMLFYSHCFDGFACFAHYRAETLCCCAATSFSNNDEIPRRKVERITRRTKILLKSGRAFRGNDRTRIFYALTRGQREAVTERVLREKHQNFLKGSMNGL